MGVKIIREDGMSCLYDSVTMTAFGVVHSGDDLDLDDFLEWLPEDARKYSNAEIQDKYYALLKYEEEKSGFY